MDKRLLILVEGPEDESFFEKVVKPRFIERYPIVQFWPYASKPNNKIKGIIQSIQAMKGDYIFTADLDENPCVSEKLKKIQKKISLCRTSTYNHLMLNKPH